MRIMLLKDQELRDKKKGVKVKEIIKIENKIKRAKS